MQEKLIFEHEVNIEPNLVRKLLLDYFGRAINFHEMTVGIMWVLATSEKISAWERCICRLSIRSNMIKILSSFGYIQDRLEAPFIRSSLIDDHLALTLTKGIGIKDFN